MRPPSVVTWLVTREIGHYVAQCCETDLVVQATSLSEVKSRASELLHTVEYLRVTHGTEIHKPYGPALAKRDSGSHIECVFLGPLEIIARLKTPWPFNEKQHRMPWCVVNPGMYLSQTPPSAPAGERSGE